MVECFTMVTFVCHVIDLFKNYRMELLVKVLMKFSWNYIWPLKVATKILNVFESIKGHVYLLYLTANNLSLETQIENSILYLIALCKDSLMMYLGYNFEDN